MLTVSAAYAVPQTPAVSAGKAKSQTAEEAAPVKKYYMQVTCSQSATTQKTTVEVNLGRLMPAMLGIPENDLKQATSSRSFPTDIDAVNFYASKGWTLVDTYTKTQGRAVSVVYVMMYETADPTEVGVSIMSR